MNIHTKIARKLAQAGVNARVIYAQGMVTVEAECDTVARDVLGLDCFTGYVDGVEVIIL